MKKQIIGAVLALGLGAQGAFAQASEATVEEMMDYMDFAPYEAGIILPEQIDQSVFESVLFIDARDEEQYSAETIPGAINIEWREVLGRMDEIPTDQKVIMFCNTGTLSSQATFALRVAGFDNVVVLQTGIRGWKETAAYHPE